MLSERALAWIGLAAIVCNLVGWLYLAYDVFQRHRGPLGLLTRLATYSVLIAAATAPLLGVAFGALCGLGIGTIIAVELWLVARTQRLHRRTPLHFPAASGLARGLVLGLAFMPRFGWRFGLVCAGWTAALLGLIYGLRLVPVYRPQRGVALKIPRALARAAVLRGAAMGAGAAAAVLLVPGEDRALGVEVAAASIAAGLAISVLAPRAEWWLENAPDSFFVASALLLIVAGLVLDAVPYVLVLL